MACPVTQGGHKKEDIKFTAVTPTNLNRLSKFFH